MDEELVSLLFETKAFKVADENKPFWYTSGKLGPYFINVDYLYGSKEDSESLLKIIDELLLNESKENIPSILFEYVNKHYEENKIFKTTIDKLVSFIEKNINIDSIDYISGGERRDWFFSILVAYLLGKPHITIFKDLTTVVSTCDFEETTLIDTLTNKNVFHVTDLLNTASSFERAWVPAITKLGSIMQWAIYPVDRNQGGYKCLENLQVAPLSLITLNEELFEIAFNKGIISENQKNILNKYFEDPEETMQEFINSHPTFINDVIANGDEKSAKRAKLCLEKGWYTNQ